MTNNTINNVPRELTIERDVFGAMHIKLGDFDFIQIQYQYPYTDNASTKALAERIAALLSAPSPAGADGLEVVLGEDTAFGRKYVRLSAAQAIIDGLRGENEALHAQVKVLQSDANSWQSGYDEGRRMGGKHCALTIDQQAQRIRELEGLFSEVTPEMSAAGHAYYQQAIADHGDFTPTGMFKAMVSAICVGKEQA